MKRTFSEITKSSPLPPSPFFLPAKKTYQISSPWALTKNYLDSKEAKELFAELLTLPYEAEVVRGRECLRKCLHFSTDPANIKYTYAGTQHPTKQIPEVLLKLLKKLPDAENYAYNYCLVNYYPDGKAGMGFHSDSLEGLVTPVQIASLSLGATRNFVLAEKNPAIPSAPRKYSMLLSQGDLLIMGPGCQENWVHGVPSTAVKSVGPRINLTFRKISVSQN